MHMIPQLRKLEQKYAKELVIIGVHSAKFTTEKETENVRQAVMRHNIEHPVVNDRNFVIWKSYGVSAWPTLVFIDPRGKVIGAHAGEIPYEALDRVVGEIVKTFDEHHLVDRTPLKFKLERSKTPQSVLSFPGKVLADGREGRLFISDTNNHRIVVASLSDGTVQTVIGSGAEGFEDGAFDAAQFNYPQGVALDGDVLYIADTENHSIRKADLKKRTVETIAGTGKQARRWNVSGRGTEVELSSPWDVTAHKGVLYIAMAGFHQLWVMDLRTQQVRPYAGSGREGLLDAPLEDAALAQPSGITTDGEQLYFADSEASAVRSADLSPNGRVRTVVGPSFDSLFEFGDVDGSGGTVRLQHPIGITHHDGALYVADTYNHKIKRVFPRTRAATTFLGTGKPGYQDGDTPQFFEPSGVSVAGGKLYIADTNNNLIRVADLKTRRVSTFELKGIEKLRRMVEADDFAGKAVTLAPQNVAPGEGKIEVNVKLPQGYKVNPDAPFDLSAAADNEQVVRLAAGRDLSLKDPKFPLTMAATFQPGATQLHLTLTVYYCEATQTAACFIHPVRLTVPVNVSPSVTGATVVVDYTVPGGRAVSRGNG